MAPGVIGDHRLACGGVVLGMQGIEQILISLEALHLGRLAHHRAQ